MTSISKHPLIDVSTPPTVLIPTTYTISGENDQYGKETLISAGESIDIVVRAWHTLSMQNGGFRFDYYTIGEWRNGIRQRYVTYVNDPFSVNIQALLDERYGKESSDNTGG